MIAGKIRALLARYERAVRFGLVGLMNTAVDFLIYTLTQLIAGFPVIASQILGYSAGLVNSYAVNKRVTFRDRERSDARKLLSFLVVNLIALGFSSLCIYLTVEGLHWNKYLAKLLVTGATMVLNYFSYKLIVFKKR